MKNSESNDFLNAYKLQEFSALKSEIGRRQIGRISILGFCIAAIGAVLKVLLDNASFDGIPTDNTIVNSHLYLIFFGYLIIICASIITANQTRHINFIGYYIRVSHEKKSGFDGWESHWYEARNKRQFWQIRAGIPKGTGLSLTVCYLLLTFILLVVPFYISSLSSLNKGLLIIATIITMAFCLNIHWGKEWKTEKFWPQDKS